jgi:hypothetical protein
MKIKTIITIAALSLVLSSNLMSKNIENEAWLTKVEEDSKYNPSKFVKAEMDEDIIKMEIQTASDSDKEIEKYANKMIYLIKYRDEKTLCKK